MGRRNRRWTPKGKGFRNLFDRGDAAAWLRRNPDKTITMVVYLGHVWGGVHAGIWEVACKPDAEIIYQVRNKPRRVVWVEEETPDDPWLGVISHERRPVPRGVRHGPKIRGRWRWRGRRWWPEYRRRRPRVERVRRRLSVPRKFR